MDNIRAVRKLILFLLCTLFFYSLILCAAALQVFGLNYIKWRSFFLNTWGKFCCKIIGMHVQTKGQAPAPPFFLVSNHLSYVDIFLLFGQVRGIFVAKSDVKQWPVIGFIIKSCGILFIDRERKRDITRVNNLIKENVNSHQGVIIFPESKTSPGLKILPFRSSLLQVPVAMKLPVSFVAISYSTEEGEEAACKQICWWDDDPFLIHFFNLLKMKKFTAVISFGEKAIISDNRKHLTTLLQKEVHNHFKPVIDDSVFANLKTGAD